MTSDTLLLEEDTEHPTPDSPLISEMFVEELFGSYTYNIRVPDSTAPHIILLYGDNGSGKTTILNLLWHLLSSAENRRHRTTVAQTPFKNFTVTLSNGDRISARKTVDLVGEFEVIVTRGQKIVCRQLYPTNSDGVVTGTSHAKFHDVVRIHDDQDILFEAELDEPDVEKDRYIEYLKNINIEPYFLADNRKIYNDHFEGRRQRHYRMINGDVVVQEDEELGLAGELSGALRRTSNWLRQQILSGTAQGSQGADAIYLDVLHQLVAASPSTNDQPSLDEVKKRIAELDARSAQFNEFGLVPHVKADPFLALLENVDNSRISVIEDVLTPYLDGQRARLDSLQPMESLIRTFVETVNSFFVNKRLTYTLRGGLTIRTTGPTRNLRPEHLSSGERQLLLLLCNSLLSRDESALFIIDEPEISLNVKWQRMLIPALLACVQSSSVQFILATHSVEIITGHRRYLAQLRDKRNA